MTRGLWVTLEGGDGSGKTTQAALLEVMDESQVSEGNTSYQLEKPFVVLATQNPIEYEGTAPIFPMRAGPLWRSFRS